MIRSYKQARNKLIKNRIIIFSCWIGIIFGIVTIFSLSWFSLIGIGMVVSLSSYCVDIIDTDYYVKIAYEYYKDKKWWERVNEDRENIDQAEIELELLREDNEQREQSTGQSRV